MLLPLAATLLLLGAPEENRSWADMSFRVAFGFEWDTNAQRALSDVANDDDVVLASPTGEVAADALSRLLVDTGAELRVADGHRIRPGYVLGAKRFIRESTEDLLVHDLTLATDHDLTEWLLIQSWGSFRASRIRSGRRDYTLGVGGGRVAFRLGRRVVLGLSADAGRFHFSVEPRLSYDGPRAGAEGQWRALDSLTLRARISRAWRYYDGNALVLGTDPSGNQFITFCDDPEEIRQGLDCEPARRNDKELQLQVGAYYRGPIVLGAEYQLRMQRSTSDLENIDRHRISAQAGVGLPMALFFNVAASLQLTNGVSVTDAQLLAEDDENQNSIQAQLSWKATEDLSLDLRYALFSNQFNTADLSFIRHTTYLGISYRTQK